MLILLLCAAMVVAWRWPQTPVGRTLHRLMVAWPARKLANLSPGKALPKLASGRVLLVLIVLIGIVLADGVFRGDVMMFLAQISPEGIAWFVTFDVATYFDVIALALMLAATVRMRAVAQALRAWVARVREGVAVRRSSARSRRPRRPVRKPPPKSSDDDGGWAPALGHA
jgi:hypothetical protein